LHMPIEIKIFSDYIWPFCYIGKGIVDKLKQTYDIHETWISYELHPETPPEGILMSERFKGYDVTQMYDNLRRRGNEFGIVFADRSVLSNSRLSLEASEYARDKGKHEQFHERIFHAYFTEAIDIGNTERLCQVASGCELDSVDMMQALKDGCYNLRLDEAKREGLKIQLTGVPTFIINDKHKIVGAQPEKVFTDILDKISKVQD
jgi:predicted DsbA family dithiol-disulfide isomerase